MRRLALMFAGLSIVAFAGLVAFCALGGITPRWLFGVLFVDAMALVKMADLMLVILLFAVVGIAVKRPRGSAAAGWGGAGFLKAMAWIAPALGVLMSLEEGLSVFSAAARFHPHLRVVAPSVAEIMLPVFLGFAVGAIAAAGARRPCEYAAAPGSASLAEQTSAVPDRG